MVVLRGFSGVPILPDFGAGYKLSPAAIAAYPMYRGLAHLVGMKIVPAGGDFDAELDALEAVSAEHDFIFLHYKPADAAGEDGDFDAKVHWLEELDARIPRVLATAPDVLVVAGDHSTPAIMAGHSWHPVPLLIRSRYTRGEGVPQFSERAFRGGSLGSLAAQNVMLSRWPTPKSSTSTGRSEAARVVARAGAGPPSRALRHGDTAAVPEECCHKEEPMTTWKDNPDGTRTWHVDQDALYAASLLEGEDAPELTQQQFEQLTDEMRKVREEEEGWERDEDVTPKEQR